MRGPLNNSDVGTFSMRIIPAYAGTTDELADADVHMEDHPRLCGDHRMPNIQQLDIGGSSPPMRGPPPTGCSPSSPPRIIPAYAGTTTVKNFDGGDMTDHPRLCGDHCAL